MFICLDLDDLVVDLTCSEASLPLISDFERVLSNIHIWDLPIVLAAIFVAEDKFDFLPGLEIESLRRALQLLDLLRGQEDLFDFVAPRSQGTRSQRDHEFCQHF